jgi:pyocin large subunit-like protein
LRSRNKIVTAFFLTTLLIWASGPGFRTRALFDAHYEKHGAEFGKITRDEYLRLAQKLRDSPAKGNILQNVRGDGVITKFDRKHGYFGAYNPDGTIRTFFVPNDGENYFRRQARRYLKNE